MSSRVTGFKEYAGEIKKREYGSMISINFRQGGGFFPLQIYRNVGILYVGHGQRFMKGW